ncbi:hypothetical protein BC629DRAFT_656533 [Irpex lacteus]|nr:hypothetical protein BC629DRAFT_656533 [Irpex lacteus]
MHRPRLPPPHLHPTHTSSLFMQLQVPTAQTDTQSCPESPIGRRVDLPRENRRWSTKKLFKPLLGPLSKKELPTGDVLTLGLNQLARSTTRDSDAASSGTTTPLRNRSRESTSENTHVKKGAKKKSLLSALMGSDSSSSGEGSLWRTQSATEQIRRTKSRESTIANEDLRRTRSNSAGVAGNRQAPRKQLRMLNGRVYGGRRNNLNNVNLFATARSDPEFVEWGYGGMGSVKTAASVGNTKYSRVQGSAAIGSAEENGWGSAQRGRQPADDDDDGSGMAWLKRRREERERAKAEAAEKAAAEAAVQDAVEMQEDVKDDHAEEKHDAEVADPDPPAPVTQEKQVEEAVIDAVESKTESEEQPTPIAVSEDAEHVTTAVKIPAHTPSPRHHSLNLGHHPHGHPMRLSAERTPIGGS